MTLEKFMDWAIEIYDEFCQDEKIKEVYRNDEKIMLVDIESEKLYTCPTPKLPVNTYTANTALAYAKFKGYEIPILTGYTKPERVKNGEPYYFIDLNSAPNGIYVRIEQYDIIDNIRYDKHNYFTKDSRAMKTVDRINFLLKLKYFHSIYCPDYEPDWSDAKDKFCVFYNHNSHKFDYLRVINDESKADIYFPDPIVAQKVCDELNKELTG